jgi:hypothetical protein
MPGNPKPLVRRQGGIAVRGTAVGLKSERGGDYRILFIDNKVAPGDTIDVNERLEETKQEILKSVPLGRVTGERAVSLTDEGGNVHPGRELQIDGDDFGKEMKYTCRIYMVGTRMIISFTGVEQQHFSEFHPNSTKFLDSLRITASIPPVE